MYPDQPHDDGLPYQFLGLKVQFWSNGGHLKNLTKKYFKKFRKFYTKILTSELLSLLNS